MERFQFSIRLMFVAMAVIAGAVAAVRAEPSWQSCLALEFLAVNLASIAITAAFKSRGALRAFWVASAVPATGAAAIYLLYGCVAGAASIMMEPDERLLMVVGGLRIALPVIWSLSLANGAVCSLIYWSCARPRSENPL